MRRTCSTCPNELGKKNQSGRCRSCVASALNSDPAIQAKRTEALRRTYATDPVKLDALRRRAAVAREKIGPSIFAIDPDRARLAGAKGNAARPKGSDIRMRAGARQRATKLADLPPDTHADYLHLTKVKRLYSAEAREIVLAEHERKIGAFRRKLLEESA